MAIPTLKEVRSFLADQAPLPTGYGNSYTLRMDGLYAKHCLYAHAAADGSSKTYDLVGPWSGRSFHIVKQEQGYACYTERLFGAEDHIVCNTPTLRDAVVLIDKKYGPKSIRYRCRRLFRQYCVPVGTRSI